MNETRLLRESCFFYTLGRNTLVNVILVFSVYAMHDSFPHALELSKKGYHAFALILFLMGRFGRMAAYLGSYGPEEFEMKFGGRENEQFYL